MYARSYRTHGRNQIAGSRPHNAQAFEQKADAVENDLRETAAGRCMYKDWECRRSSLLFAEAAVWLSRMVSCRSMEVSV